MSPGRAPAPTFLPPQPVYDRGRRPRAGRGIVAAIVIGLGVALVTPLALSILGSASGPLQLLGGGVAGAVSGSQEPESNASTGPVATDIGPSLEPSVAPAPPSGAPGPPDAGNPPLVVELTAPPIASLIGYRWPIPEGRISLPFKAIPGGEWWNRGKLFHDGVDMASFCGARVGAAHSGVVLAAGRHFDTQIGWIGNLKPYFHLLNIRHSWGNLPIVVVIDDGNGYRSIYAHFRDVSVKVGQHVKAGQEIGHEGATGHASGCHVHYGLFSPLETRTFGVRADILKRLKLPAHVIARVDPLAVMPGGDVALRTRQIARAIAAAHAELARQIADEKAARTSGR